MARRVIGVTCVLLVTMAAPAWAHNSLRSSSPAEGERLASAPSEWVLTFVNEVPIDSASGEITLADGSTVALPAPVQGVATNIVRFLLPTDLDGVVDAHWRLVSPDGHPLTGTVRFGIGDVGDLSILASGVASAAAASSGAPDIVRWVVRMIGFVAVMIVGGLLVAELHLVRGAFSALRRSRLLKATSIAIAAAPVVQMLIFLGDVHGTSFIGGLSHLFGVFDSTAGAMFAVRCLLGAVIGYQLVSVLPFEDDTRSHRLVLATFTMYLVTLAYTGHARSMKAPVLGIPADVIHMAAASVWLGGLAMLVFVISPLISTKDLFRAFQRYATVATPAVIALLVTGLIQTFRLHGSIGTLFTSSHGRLLLLKIALVAVTLRLGDVNRKRVSSKMMANPHVFDTKMAVLLRMATMEAALGGGVLAITAALVGSSLE